MERAIQILVLADQSVIRSEAIEYAEGLAKRLDARVWIYVVVSRSPDRNSENDHDELKRCLVTLAEQGITAQARLSYGDPRSELLKYMAQGPDFHTIIWGGAETTVARGIIGSDHPWLGALGEELRCPFIVPYRNDLDRKD